MRVYESFIAVELSESKYQWAGTDRNRLLLPSDTDIPSSVSKSTAMGHTPSKTTHSGTAVFSLTSPHIFDGLAVIDGVITGYCKFSVNSKTTGSGTITLSQVDLKLLSEDQDGVETTLLDETIWTGSMMAVVGGTTYVEKGTMFWLNVSDVTIGIQNRLKAEYTLHYSVYDPMGGGSGNWRVSLHCDFNNKNTGLTMPFVLGQ